MPPAINPARHRAWGVDSFVFFPNFMILVWQTGWYLTYHYWPTSYNTHIFEGTLYFVPPKNARERLQQELAAVTSRSTPSRTATRWRRRRRCSNHEPFQRSPSMTRRSFSGSSTRRRGATSTTTRRASPRRSGFRPRPKHGGPIECQSCRLNSASSSSLPPGPSRPRRSVTSKRLSSTLDEIQAFYDAAFPRLDDAMTYLDQFEFAALPAKCVATALALLFPGQCLFPRSRCGANLGFLTAEPPAWTC